MTLDATRLVKLASKHYQSSLDPEIVGDTLAEFIAAELRETFDPHTDHTPGDIKPRHPVLTAVYYMELAEADLHNVTNGLFRDYQDTLLLEYLEWLVTHRKKITLGTFEAWTTLHPYEVSDVTQSRIVDELLFWLERKDVLAEELPRILLEEMRKTANVAVVCQDQSNTDSSKS